MGLKKNCQNIQDVKGGMVNYEGEKTKSTSRKKKNVCPGGGMSTEMRPKMKLEPDPRDKPAAEDASSPWTPKHH